MYILERTFEVPIGHRLSKHKRKCRFVHGHNFVITVKIKSKTLNSDDMVIDFSDIKRIVGTYLNDMYDHACMINSNDQHYTKLDEMSSIVLTQGDPTAENLACHLAHKFNDIFMKGEVGSYENNPTIHSVKVQEATGAAVTYVLD